MLIVKEGDHLLESQNILKLHVSDHFLINCTLNIAKPSNVKTTYACRNFRSIDSNAFECDLSDGLNKILFDDINNVDSLVRRYNQACKEVLDSRAPVTVCIRTKRYKPLWFNNCVDEAQRARRRHERKYRKTHSELDRVAYIQSQCNVVNVITDAKCHYYNEKLSGSNSKEMFKTLNELLNKKSSTLPDCILSNDLANELCEFFTAKVDKVRNKVDNICSTSDANVIHDCRQKVDGCMSTFKSVNVEDLTKIIMKSPSKSCLLDPLPTWLLKKHLPSIMPVLCHIVNVSLETGQFPSELRKAIISPVLKKPSLDRHQLGSYRPVSNLSYLGKLIERVVSY